MRCRQPPPRVKRQLTALPAPVLMTAENSPARWPPHLPLPLPPSGDFPQRCKLFRQNGPKLDVVAVTTASSQGLMRLRGNCKSILQPDSENPFTVNAFHCGRSVVAPTFMSRERLLGHERHKKPIRSRPLPPCLCYGLLNHEKHQTHQPKEATSATDFPSCSSCLVVQILDEFKT